MHDKRPEIRNINLFFTQKHQRHVRSTLLSQIHGRGRGMEEGGEWKREGNGGGRGMEEGGEWGREGNSF